MSNVEIFFGDCLDILPTLPDKSVEAIITDLPYGTTACKWDSIIPFEPMWKEVKRLLKLRGVFVTTASQPFTTSLIASNMGWFRYEWIWDKVNRYTGTFCANKKPLKIHENVLVFSNSQPTYNKQYRPGKPYYRSRKSVGVGEYVSNTSKRIPTKNNGNHNPCSIICIEADNKKEMGFHPTQKPVALYEYLIKTYTNEGDTVLDFCMGSGTTGVACKNLNRNFIGIEKDEKYFLIAKDRLEKENG